MSYTFTQTQSSSFSESRASYVMSKVYRDLLSLVWANIITKETADSWREDISDLLKLEVLDSFQIQLHKKGEKSKALEYVVKDAEILYSDDKSGGINFFEFPNETFSSLLVSLRPSSKNYASALEELKRRGWGTGTKIIGASNSYGIYSKENYGLSKSLKTSI